MPKDEVEFLWVVDVDQLKAEALAAAGHCSHTRSLVVRWEQGALDAWRSKLPVWLCDVVDQLQVILLAVDRAGSNRR